MSAPLTPQVQLLYRGMRTSISLLTEGDQTWIEKRLLPFADVEPERILLAREARLHLVCKGPGIVPLRNLEAESVARQKTECSFFHRNYVDGFSLRDHLLDPQRHQLPPELDSPLSIVRALARILKEFEAKKSRWGRALGVVHRDVSPGNVLVDRRGKLWLNDLGLVHLSNLELLEQDEMAQGYRPFLSPEQCRGTHLDHKSDIYQAALLFALLLTLRQSSTDGLWDFRTTAPRVRARARQTLREHFPASGLIECLEEDPAHRPSAHEFYLLLCRLGHDCDQRDARPLSV